MIPELAIVAIILIVVSVFLAHGYVKEVLQVQGVFAWLNTVAFSIQHGNNTVERNSTMTVFKQLLYPMLPELRLSPAETSSLLGVIMLVSVTMGIGAGFVAFLFCPARETAVETLRKNRLAIFSALFGGFLLPLSIAIILLLGRLWGVMFALGAVLMEIAAAKMVVSARKSR